MTGQFLTLDDFDLLDKTVLLRVDINSPIDPVTGRILNDSRLREHLLTLRDLREARVAIMAHQSRPGKDDCTSMEPHAERLSYLLGREVQYVDSLFGRSAVSAIRALEPGGVVLLENTRFYAEEELFKDIDGARMTKLRMVRTLAPLANYFVNDAFSAAHRAQPSLTGFCEVLPSAAGRVMEKELRVLTRALHGPERPKVAALGGVKAEDSIAVIHHFLANRTVDQILTSGGVANMFLWAAGKKVGKATEDFLRREVQGCEDLVSRAAKLLEKFSGHIVLPSDVAVNEGGRRKDMGVEDLPSRHPIQDIGLDTVGRYIRFLREAKTIILNGPSGLFEVEEFSWGTRELFQAVAESTAFKVAGGGHTVAALEQLGLAGRMDHVSTGGGALVDFMAGRPMPVVEALKRAKERYAPVGGGG
jgi:phosphoglycerate kinase